ncbi:MAG: hypothetical protein JWN01_221 [Patescibacteria group bacterium]|nr:hypothetical protein [Patescibacteria group bacterium]
MSKKTLPYIAITALWLGYVTLSLLSPATANNPYHLTGWSMILVRATIFIPILLVWLIALDGALAFKHYSVLVQKGTESRGISLITNGLFWSLGYIIFIGLSGAILPYFLHTNYAKLAIILRDHLPAALTLIAFYLLYQGSHQLKQVANFTTWTRSTMGAFAMYLVFAMGFVLAFAHNMGAAANPSNPNSSSILHQNVLLFTLVLPYLAAWFMGLLASINIVKYSRQVKGVLYRHALANLVRGIWGIVAFAVTLQVLTFATRFLLGLSLASILILIYVLLILYAMGFVFIRSSAKKLTRIEAVE